jgi:hypothetical protein
MDAARVVDITITGMVSESGSRDQPRQAGIDDEEEMGFGVAANRGKAPIQLFFSACGNDDITAEASKEWIAEGDGL